VAPMIQRDRWKTDKEKLRRFTGREVMVDLGTIKVSNRVWGERVYSLVKKGGRCQY